MRSTYGLVVTGGRCRGGERQARQGRIGHLVRGARPTASVDKLAAAGANPVTGSSLDYTSRRRPRAARRSTYEADGRHRLCRHAPPAPRRLASGAKCDLGSYPSIYGTMKLCSGNAAVLHPPLTEPTASLDLGTLSERAEEGARHQVNKDVAAMPAFPADTYFGGKALYRAAMLTSWPAAGARRPAAADSRPKLTEELGQWTDPHGCAKRDAFCFVYDEQAKGIVGLTPSFGSDEFNDHHFHYGYFLYAAGVLAAERPGPGQEFAPVMDLLAADIASANAGTTRLLPRSPVPSTRTPATRGPRHRLRSPTATTRSPAPRRSPPGPGWRCGPRRARNTHWRPRRPGCCPPRRSRPGVLDELRHRRDPVYSGFGHKIVPLNWGGKRDYATWFSPEPAAMLGILLIPMSPASTYLGGRPGADRRQRRGGDRREVRPEVRRLPA